LPYRPYDLKQRRPSIILVQVAAAVTRHVVRHEFGMVGIQQWTFHQPPPVGIPVHRHRIGEVSRSDTDIPAVPIEKENVVASAFPWQKGVPKVRVAMRDRDVGARIKVGEQTRGRAEPSVEKIAALRRQDIADAVLEAPDDLLAFLQPRTDSRGVGPASQGNAEPRVVPPRGLEARQRA
jgi:hypothetical protein